MSHWPHDILPCFALAAASVTVPLLSMILTAIGVLLLVGLGLMFAMRRREPPPPSISAADRRAMEDLIADAEELTARLASSVDAKAARLERLLAQADERLARLEAQQLADSRPRVEHRTAGTSGVDDSSPLNRRVYDLADRGMPPVEIAKQLSQQVGQVELILNLRRG